MTGQTYTMIGIEELIDRLESRHQKAIKANVLDTPISVKILGKIVKALRDHKAKIEQYESITDERIKDYMLEMGYGWEQAYFELQSMAKHGIRDDN